MTSSNAKLVRHYDLYREAIKELIRKVSSLYVGEAELAKSAKSLGIPVRAGNDLVLSSPGELNSLVDFALNEYLIDGNKNAFKLYLEKVAVASEIEKVVIDAFLSSRLSLFRIASVFPDESYVVMDDLLDSAGDNNRFQENSQDKGIRLVDRLLSKSATSEMLLFTRLIRFEDLTMTSGWGFVFRRGLQNYLLRKSSEILRGKDPRTSNDSTSRFICFCKLNRTCGMSVSFGRT